MVLFGALFITAVVLVKQLPAPLSVYSCPGHAPSAVLGIGANTQNHRIIEVGRDL